MLSKLTLKQAITKLNKKEISLGEIYADVTKQIEKKNQKLNVYLTLNNEAEAAAHKARRLPLHGLPIAVKDNYCTLGLKTTASSTVLDNFVPQFESTVTHKLQAGGGVIIGKTNMDAWAHGSSTETSQYGRTLNPRNIDYLPGGSSGGSGAAVAADMCLAALGTETAGSIRQPASWCGVVGLKPSYGRVSRAGIVAMASSTDSPGPITKTVEDAAILLSVIAGHDPYDATTSPQSVPDFTKSLHRSIKNLKIGVLYQHLPGLEKVTPIFNQQLKVLTELGAKLEPAASLDPRLAISVYTIIQRSEVSSNLARYTGLGYGQDRSHFGDEAKRRVMLGTFTLSKGYADQYYRTAQRVRTLFIQDFARLFNKYDLLVSLSSPGYAKKVGASTGEVMFGELEDMLLEPSSITGLPGINVPCYQDPNTGLFLGMNLMAPMWREDLVIRAASAYEAATLWNTWQNEK